jgi:hypothetical protein
LSEAVRLDPQFALAYLHLSSVYNDIGDFRRASETAAKVEHMQERLPRRQFDSAAGHSQVGSGSE